MSEEAEWVRRNCAAVFPVGSAAHRSLMDDVNVTGTAEETKAMSNFYGTGSRRLQDEFDTRRLADKEINLIVHDEITHADRAFIEGRDMFFLATVDREGRPQCSYKGGAPGFVKVIDARTIAFPCYDGNGMFLSMGNILENSQVGVLFIDFENPQRLRLNGTAALHEEEVLLSEYQEAQFMVRIHVERVFVNCPRYVHRFKKMESSEFVPSAMRETPIPHWKTLAAVQEVLPARDLERATQERLGPEAAKARLD